ncbi:MAG: hypothetical protein ABSD09_05775 [Xanthobacteraceae bacterium]
MSPSAKDILLTHNQRVAVGKASRHLVEMHANGLADERRHRHTMGIALGELGHEFLPGRF